MANAQPQRHRHKEENQRNNRQRADDFPVSPRYFPTGVRDRNDGYDENHEVVNQPRRQDADDE